MLTCQPLDLGHVHEVVVLAHVVGRGPVELAGEVEPHAVGEVAAVREVEAEDPLAGVQERRHGRSVGLRARVRLHVGVLRAEQRLQAVDRQLLDDVDVLATPVVATPRIALGVLVGQHRALGRHDGQWGEVLARDHFQGRLLAGQLGRDRRVHLGVRLGQASAEDRVGAASRLRLHGHAHLGFRSWWSIGVRAWYGVPARRVMSARRPCRGAG
jgi:hypothetical protein